MVATPLIEAIARAIANNLIEQDGFDDPKPDIPVVWSWIDQGETDFRLSAQAALTAITEAGYAVVPIEPTEAMTLAGVQTECGLGPYTLPDVIAASYRAMISAAQGDGE